MRLGSFLARVLAGLPGRGGEAHGPPDDDDDDGLTVRTRTGRYTGLQNPEYSGVREFRSIPYAEPPLGPWRWKPPRARRPSQAHHYAYRFPPSCTQYLAGRPSLWNSNTTGFMINLDGQAHDAGWVAQTSAEDCLCLAVWTPRRVRPGPGLPVALFVPGGSFVRGGVDTPYQQPAGFVSRTQAHIVVTLNWRVGLFGFAGAAGLAAGERNLGVLDARLALEWVHANIAAFGGDPARIVVWGHSAGGGVADLLSFAYPDDPRAAGFFLHSGLAVRPDPVGSGLFSTPADAAANFTFVARRAGCDFPADPAAELDCMRQVPAGQLANLVGRYADSWARAEAAGATPGPPLLFRGVVDGRVVFADYLARAAAGRLARVPVLIGTTANEGSSLAPYPRDLAAGPNQTEVDEGTLTFVCAALNGTGARNLNGIPAYRFQYAGNFSSIAPLWWMGAAHASDVPLLFGTWNLSGRATDAEQRVATVMQDHVLAFLRDPANGLRNKGWAPDDTSQNASGTTMVRFAVPGGALVESIAAQEVDGPCMNVGRYDSRPTSYAREGGAAARQRT